MSFRVLVYSHTAKYRHESIPAGVAALSALGEANGFEVDHSEDPAVFTAENLARYRVVAWLSPSGDALTDGGKAAFQAFIGGGGGFVGIHAATDAEYGWPWYGGLLGGDAWFLKHPQPQPATVHVVDRGHLSTRHYPESFTVIDEWYNYRNNPAPHVRVLMRLDETTYHVGEGAMGSDHPIAWCHEYEGGRAWYTGLGHNAATFAEPAYRQHLLGGILWAAGEA